MPVPFLTTPPVPLITPPKLWPLGFARVRVPAPRPIFAVPDGGRNGFDRLVEIVEVESLAGADGHGRSVGNDSGSTQSKCTSADRCRACIIIPSIPHYEDTVRSVADRTGSAAAEAYAPWPGKLSCQGHRQGGTVRAKRTAARADGNTPHTAACVCLRSAIDPPAGLRPYTHHQQF